VQFDAIVGNSGSGKTCVSRHLGALRTVPAVNGSDPVRRR